MFWTVGRWLAWSAIALWAFGLVWYLPGARDAGDALGIVLALSITTLVFLLLLSAAWCLVDLAARVLRMIP